jgi:proteasome accessory factor B
VVGTVRRSGRPGSYEPPEVDLISYVARWSGPVERTRKATVLVRKGRAAGIRRYAEEVIPGDDGDRVVLRYADAEWLAGRLVGYGADVLVLDPPEVRDFVVKRLHEIAGAHPGSLQGAHR